jgi:hypothetical protein
MSMDDREKVYENKFALDQQVSFRIEARASKLIGLWAAAEMGMSDAEAADYAKEVVASNLDEPGYDDVKRKVLGDFANRGREISDHLFSSVIDKMVTEARRQILSEND